MKRNKKILGLICSIGLMLGSCSDFLTQVNPNEMTTDMYFKNLAEIETGLVAVYNSFRSPNLIQVVAENHRADLTWPSYNRPTVTNEYYLQTFTEASGAPGQKWDACYQGIFRANQVIAALERMESAGEIVTENDQEQYTNIMAQTRFLRGWFYFTLHNSFNHGKVIIRESIPVETEDFYQALSSSEEVLEYYRKDLMFAFENLPDFTSEYPTGENKERVTSGSAAAVLGKSYLYNNEYDEASVYFNKVLNEYDYSLAGVDENWTTKGEFNSESILEVNYSEGYKPEQNMWSSKGIGNPYAKFLSPKGGWVSARPSLWMIMAYKEDPMDTLDTRNLYTYTDINGEDSIGIRKYSLRCSYSMAIVDDDLEFYQKKPGESLHFNNLTSGYYRKHINWDIYGNENESAVEGVSGVNYRLIRLADVMLMQAECLIKGGEDDNGVQEAITLINRVRNRSALEMLGYPATSEFPSAQHNEIDYNAKTLMDHLMYLERPKELAMEGNAIRQLDLRRWGVTKERFQFLSTDYYHFTTYHHHYTDEKTGEPKVWDQWSSVLNRGLHPENQKYTGVDYVQAAQNYNEETHGWWPIPLSEVVSNPNL